MQLQTKLINTIANKTEVKEQLKANGFAILHHFLSEHQYLALKHEVDKLEQFRLRRDFVMLDYESDRHLSTIGGSVIRKESQIIKGLYSSDEILDELSILTGTPLYRIDHPEEYAVINWLTNPKDIHGWHLDDPKYALVIAIEMPEKIEDGGYVEVIPNWKQFIKEHHLEEAPVTDQLQKAYSEKAIGKVWLSPGDAYLINAGETFHQVAPLKRGQRVIVNFAYHDSPKVQYGRTADLLYGNNEKR
jgi:hypothetical protein